ncbi:MAG TPA: molybdenum cofactor biosynthesis protein MoaE [Acidimicrobiales bacterium]|nr:molybdenum cofactor biosynthesis protein MoaE [Acidimicrobiales bacterium]
MPRCSAAGDWVEVTAEPLPTAAVTAWAVVPTCGAVSVFCGTVRDHSEGRPGVVRLEYDAYVEHVVPRLDAIADSVRTRWPEVGRVALLHRVGTLAVGETSVVVAVSTPHREEAFAASSWCIDTVKATVPIWKREVWEGGSDWGLCTHDLVEVDDLGAGS